jgi:ActR/RegA family two-component response regulator
VSLPDLSGLDLQKRIVDRAGMPIIFITGYGDVPTSVQAMKAGAMEFFTQPFSRRSVAECHQSEPSSAAALHVLTGRNCGHFGPVTRISFRAKGRSWHWPPAAC